MGLSRSSCDIEAVYDLFVDCADGMHYPLSSTALDFVIYVSVEKLVWRYCAGHYCLLFQPAMH